MGYQSKRRKITLPKRKVKQRTRYSTLSAQPSDYGYHFLPFSSQNLQPQQYYQYPMTANSMYNPCYGSVFVNPLQTMDYNPELGSDSSSGSDTQDMKVWHNGSGEASTATEFKYLNSPPELVSSDQFNGVYWNPVDKRYIAMLSVNGRQKQLGSFESELRAAIFIDTKIKLLKTNSNLLNFDNDLQSNLALTILDNYGAFCQEYKANKLRVDRNGFPTLLEEVLDILVNSIDKRKSSLYSKPKQSQVLKPKTKFCVPKNPIATSAKRKIESNSWNTLVEVASRQSVMNMPN